MNKIFKLLFTLPFIILFSGCQSIRETIKMKDIEDPSKSEVKETMEISISCDEKNIDEFINQGWVIAKEYSEEKICSWITVPANSKCDMEKDKGCKITKPDKIGKEIFYLLEK